MIQKIKEKIFFIRVYQKIFLILILSIARVNEMMAQPDKDYFFQKITTLNGLSSNTVQCIFRDSRGYVWVGTSNGLNRYDGKNIKVYHHDANNPYSLPRESVRTIVEDQNGILWIGADYGLIEFNPITEQFNFYLHETNNPKSLNSDHIPNPFVDSKNNLWIGTEFGLQLFDRRLHTFKTFLPADSDSIKKNARLGWTGNVLEDNKHNIWCTGAKGLYKVDNRNRELKLFPFQDKLHGLISCTFIDHEGKFWVGFWSGGLVTFDPENCKFDPINNLKFNRDGAFENINEWRDPLGIDWLTISTTNGLLLYNHSSKKNSLIQADRANPYALSDNGLSYIYTDKENILWIGTDKGLNILDNANQLFHFRLLTQGNSFEVNQVPGAVETIYEDKDLKMVSFEWARGLGIYDRDWNLVKYFKYIPPSDKSLEARDIFGIYKDFRGIYWITTDNGLVRFDIKKNLFKIILPHENDNDLLRGPKLMREIIPFDSTHFYIHSKTHGIYKFDFIKEQFIQHLVHDDKNPKSLPTNSIRTVIKDDKNQLIIISVNAGIFIYSPKNNGYEIFNHHADASINEALNNLYFDPCLSGETLWLNSAHGLLRFDLDSRQFKLFNSRDGLANDFILSNEVDKEGNIWVAHNAGISMLDKKSETFTNYSENNGLVFKGLNYNMRKMADGSICIGDGERMIYFNPAMFKANQNIPQVHINAVQILNEPYNFTLDSVSHKKTLTLSYDQDLITVDFSVLNFSNPNKNSFYFRLDKDSVWHKVNEGSVNLVRLSPGKYVLHVTGSNNSGLMNPTGDSLSINILPPYYHTWWFRVLLVIAAFLILFEIRRRGIRNIKREEQLKTEFNKQLAQAETKALRAQMNPHFIFNCLNSINSLIIDQKHEIASEHLIRFSKLIRLVLDNSRSETITLAKELETLKLYVLLESARYDNKFNCIYTIDENADINSIMIPPMLLQPYVENAIWHGLMQKEDEGTITVEIKKQDEEFLNISISDDGIGRKKAAELKSKSATHKSYGLKVTSQRIEMMNKLSTTGAHVNIIDLHDELGQAIGTKVELIIPF